MQDMSGVTTEPASSPPRILASDVAVEKSVTDTKESKAKNMPKVQRSDLVLENHKKLSIIAAETGEDQREEEFICKHCDKVLGSAAGLEKHMQLHNGERSFRCRICNLTFNTNSALHRHMRLHKQGAPRDTDSDDSEGSSRITPPRVQPSRKRRIEFNNNDKSINGGHSADDEQTPGGKRKAKNINNNCISGVVPSICLDCPVCDGKNFSSPNILEVHIEREHPEYQVECTTCNLSFKNHRVLNLHRSMVHRGKDISKKLPPNSVSGFTDCTFIDFSIQKFPQIAKEVCEKSVHKSVTEQKFRCDHCPRDFPCESALEIHRKTCLPSSSGESDDFSKRRDSSSTDEDAKRKVFFDNLMLNRSPNYAPGLHVLPKLGKQNIPSDFYPIKEVVRHLPNHVDNKDLADIQSILSVASSGGLIEQLSQKNHEVSTHANDQGSRGSDEHEEVQDVFAAEFRKMKLRGEFPCRLCTAIFPNLRALKGHNRVHLSGNGPGPYKCNMCPQSSLDKAALVRHMRTHNGDRPYECGVCNYAFTTKANCERHLRNRHSKVTREDVKRSIIYHPSEDPNNDEINNKLNICREDMKRSITFGNPENEHREEQDKIYSERITPISNYPREPLPIFKKHSLPTPIQRDMSIVIPQPRDILRPHCSIDPIRPIIPPIPEDILQKRLKQGRQLTQIPEFTESDIEKEADSEEEIEPMNDTYHENAMNYSSEVPMDLSTGDIQEDVLDLSKKKRDKNEDQNSDTETENYNLNTIEYNNNQPAPISMFEKTQQFLLAQQQLLKGLHPQKLDPAASFYVNQLCHLYRTGAAFPGLGMSPAFPLNPYVLPHNIFVPSPANPKEVAEMKERLQKEIIRGLQLSGGGLVGIDPSNIALATERMQVFHQHQQAMNKVSSPELKSHTPVPTVKTEEDIKPALHVNTVEPATNVAYSHPVITSPKIQKKETASSSSPNSVKMVIKNGVLMPKQKQRRYRTERPFSCEHCSARFTLRSNMERHIKQQHPQYWSQRQRSNIGMPRKSPISSVPQNITVPSCIYGFNQMKNMHPNDIPSTGPLNGEEKESSMQSSGLPVNKTYNMISDQVKYAILAQQLKSQSGYSQPKTVSNKVSLSQTPDNEEEDEEDALVIDEEDNAEEMSDTTKDLPITNSTEHLQPNQSDPNLKAKKVAQEILIGVSSKTQNSDMAKDFDWKITGNLISKHPQQLNAPNSVIPTFVTQIGQGEISKGEQDASNKNEKHEEGDLVPVSRLLDNAVTQIPFGKYFKNDFTTNSEVQQQKSDINIPQQGEGSEEDEEGLISGSTSEGNNSGSDENRSESETTTQVPQKKKSAYSLAPNRVSCTYCHRKFPWSSSLRRHVLTHTGQKPYKCPHCPLLFTTKSNCDRHLLRKHGSHSLPTQQNLPSTSNADLPSNSVSIPGLGNQGFMMRNVPERPYKCANCPSSTFSTLGNLKKHMSSKHGIKIPDSAPGSPKTEDANHNDNRENDSQMTSDDEKPSNYSEIDVEMKDISKNHSESGGENKNDWDSQISSKYSPSYTPDAPSNMQNSDLPFKCHLCDHSYGERQEALDHIKELHTSEYELLMSKGALETSAPFGEELGSSTPGHRSEGGEEQTGEENGEQQRGKFPDYTNRKVVCAFCMRRFWSAEDLRRHMRTHTGERPFSCDVCRRRFTLKHSMLRHRKKHATSSSVDSLLSAASGDEADSSVPSSKSSPSTSSASHTFSPLSSSYANTSNVTPNSSFINITSTPISAKNNHLTLNGYQMAINHNMSPEIPSNVNNNNSPPAYEGKVKLRSVVAGNDRKYSSEDNEGAENEAESGNDLIGNLLGISDRGMINKLLSSVDADEAAKLLRVNK